MQPKELVLGLEQHVVQLCATASHGFCFRVRGLPSGDDVKTGDWAHGNEYANAHAFSSLICQPHQRDSQRLDKVSNCKQILGEKRRLNCS